MNVVKLESLTDRKIGYGIVQPGASVPNGIPVIKVNNIISGLRNISDLDTTTVENESKYTRTRLVGGELIISVVGTIGKTAIVPADFAGCNLVRATAMIDIKDPLITQWVKYYIDSPMGQHYIAENLNTTVQPTLNVKSLVEMPIPMYSSEYIENVVSILKSLDDKIECNRRINENLEQQAQALFKSWFVDFEPFKEQPFVESELGMIPQGWRVEKLGTICNCLLGGTPSRNNPEYWNGDIAWINSGEVNKFRITKPSECITEEGLKRSATKLLPKKTTVLAITGATLGQISLLEIDSCANQSVIGILENERYPYSFIYPLIKERIEELMSHMTGGAQQHINKNNVEYLDVIEPPQDVMDVFNNKIKPLYELIGDYCIENDRLAELRDALLPKLMSGELKVENVTF